MGDTSARNFSLQTILCLTYNFFFFYHTVTHIPCSTGIKSLLDGKLSNILHFLSGYWHNHPCRMMKELDKSL